MQDKKKKLWKIIFASIVLAVVIVIAFPFIKPIRVTWSSLPYIYTIYGTHIEINRYTGNEEEVVIPDTICFRPVTVLRTTEDIGGEETYGKECVFADSTIGSVYIPDTVESIGECCFLRCENLTEVHLPFGLKKIEDSTFLGCTSLESILIPENVRIIGCSAFAWCEQLSYVEIPAGVEKIDGDSFKGTAWETTWGDGFIIAGKNVLLHYAGDEKNIEIPEGVEFIGSGALEECTNAEQLLLPESVRECDMFIIGSSDALKYIVVKNEDMIFPRELVSISPIYDEPLPTLVAEKGSTAEAYAKENGYPFLESIPEE